MVAELVPLLGAGVGPRDFVGLLGLIGTQGHRRAWPVDRVRQAVMAAERLVDAQAAEITLAYTNWTLRLTGTSDHRVQTEQPDRDEGTPDQPPDRSTP